MKLIRWATCFTGLFGMTRERAQGICVMRVKEKRRGERRGEAGGRGGKIGR